MARQVELEVEIDEKGTVHVHVKGRKGTACLEYLELVQQVLGPVTSQTYTSEYYEQETAEIRQPLRAKEDRAG